MTAGTDDTHGLIELTEAQIRRLAEDFYPLVESQPSIETDSRRSSGPSDLDEAAIQRLADAFYAKQEAKP